MLQCEGAPVGDMSPQTFAHRAHRVLCYGERPANDPVGTNQPDISPVPRDVIRDDDIVRPEK